MFVDATLYHSSGTNTRIKVKNHSYGNSLDYIPAPAQADALAISTQKGLLALYGMGFLYVRRELAEKMHPPYVARFGIDMGRADVHESDLGDGTFKFMPAARRFDLGNYNFAAVCAVHESLKLLLSIGTKNIESHTVKLAHALAQGLLDLGLPVCAGKPGPQIGEIVTVGQYGSGGESTPGVRICGHELLRPEGQCEQRSDKQRDTGGSSRFHKRHGFLLSLWSHSQHRGQRRHGRGRRKQRHGCSGGEKRADLALVRPRDDALFGEEPAH